MLKAICFKDVQAGDVVCQDADKHRTVGAVSEERNPYIQLFIREGGFIQEKPDQLIGLVHRPWPEGNTEEGMRASIILFAYLVCTLHQTELTASFDKATSDLRKAIEAYELGKPPESDK